MSGPSMNDLPPTIIFDIVLKLPVKSIVMCKCVCKSWRGLISDPNFAELHFAQAKTCTLVRDIDPFKISRSLYLLEPEDVCRPDSGYCRCRADERCCHGRFNMEVKSKLKIPLSNAQVMLDKVGNDYDSRSMFCMDFEGNSGDLVRLESGYSHRYDVVNSCNGLLCLSRKYQTDTKIVVCNPVTGEFTYLPEIPSDYSSEEICSVFIGFGFSPKHNQYKVVTIFIVAEKNPDVKHSFVSVAQIHTVGTDSWRSLDIPEVKRGGFFSPAYLDGALCCIFFCRSQKDKLASFDFDEERFRVHSVIPCPHFPRQIPSFALRAIGGRIFLYTEYSFTHLDIWVMGDNGISDISWIKLFSINVSELQGPRENYRYKLICCLNNEAVCCWVVLTVKSFTITNRKD